eukprot:gnl/Dysnectes_brevis/1199_a1341_3467.p1 GENE.gnl/Dysnectes_brevis/1199_a1341_3467~~gnl/Dysnectes_brevis/1199_a1341_3467.p1  ORF type:complete len:543 (-),score=164.28 gnl/Dysnectes_brevis/1199_a1341_3467:29-1657(-)
MDFGEAPVDSQIIVDPKIQPEASSVAAVSVAAPTPPKPATLATPATTAATVTPAPAAVASATPAPKAPAPGAKVTRVNTTVLDISEEMLSAYGMGKPDEDLEIEVRCINSHQLLSGSSWEELNLPTPLIKALYRIHFEKPSLIQAKSLPIIFQDPPQHLIAEAPSGTGKTCAFALGMLRRIDPSLQQLQSICLVPTRELAIQVARVVYIIGKSLGLELFVAIAQASNPTRTPQIVVGTPGTVRKLLLTGSTKTKKVKKGRKVKPDMSRAKHYCTNVRVVVMDEADQLLAPTANHSDDVRRVISVLPPSTQRLLFSATLDDTVADVLQRDWAPGAASVRVAKKLKSVVQLSLDCQSSPREEVLDDIFGVLDTQGGQTIVFVRTHAIGNELKRFLESCAHRPSLIHSGLDKIEQDRVMEDFRLGKIKVLISTDKLARGVDVPQVALVVNYDLPIIYDGPDRGKVEPRNYIHRIGRTSRFGRKGVAISLVGSPKAQKDLNSIRAYIEAKYGTGEDYQITAVTVDTLEQVVDRALGRRTEDEDKKE